MTVITIRPATSFDDYEQGLTLIKAHIGSLNMPEAAPYIDVTPGSLQDLYSAPGAAFLLAWHQQDASPFGCTAYKPFSHECTQINYVYVRPEHRAQGAGRSLMRAALAGARMQGYREAILSTLPLLSAANALYESLGFERIEPAFEDLPGAIYYGKPL